MAWKPDAKEILGFDPADLKTKLDKIDTISIDDITASRTNSESALNGVNEIRQTLNGLTQALAQPRRESTAATVETPSFEENPEAALNARLNPLTHAILDTRARLEIDAVRRSKVRDANGRTTFKFPYWDEYDEEIQKLIAVQPIQSQCNRSVIENCYKTVIADKMEEIIQNRAKRGANYHLESSANNGVAPVTKGDDQPTQSDVEQAAKFKMTPEQYMKSRKALTYVGV